MSTCSLKRLPEATEQDLIPLFNYLSTSQKDFNLKRDGIKFQRGVVNQGGDRLDLCKQNIGPNGAQFIVRGLIEQRKKAIEQSQDQNNRPTIKNLLLGDNNLREEGAKHLSQLLESIPLKTLYLGCNHIGDRGIEFLIDGFVKGNVRRFEQEFESGSKQAEEIIENLHNNSHSNIKENLEGLWLKRNNIGPRGAELLGQWLSQQYLYQNPLKKNCDEVNDSKSKEVVQPVQELYSQTLETLDLDGNALYNQGVDKLLKCLSFTNSHNLKILFLSHVQLDHQGCSNISSFLEINQTLVHLYLCCNLICDEGIAEIGKGLQKNHTLRLLDVQSCGINEEGIQKFTELISDPINSQCRLSDLLLGKAKSSFVREGKLNRISDKGLHYIVQHLISSQSNEEQNNKNLHENYDRSPVWRSGLSRLSIDSNEITDLGATELYEKLKNNLILCSLSIHQNKISSSLINYIKQKVSSNKNFNKSVLNFSQHLNHSDSLQNNNNNTHNNTITTSSSTQKHQRVFKEQANNIVSVYRTATTTTPSLEFEEKVDQREEKINLGSQNKSVDSLLTLFPHSSNEDIQNVQIKISSNIVKQKIIEKKNQSLP